MWAEASTERGVSPVVGVVLLVAVVTTTAVVAGVVIFGLSDETDPAPNVAMRLEPTGDGVTYTLRHVSGDDLSGNRTRLAGVADEEALDGEHLRAGETVEVVPVDTDVKLLWYGENTGYTLHTFDVDPGNLPFGAGGIDHRCPYAEQKMTNNSGDLDMNSEQIACDVTEDTDTGYTDIDIDIDSNSTLIGNIDTDGDIDVDSSIVAGDMTTTGNDITVTDESEIYGDVVASPGTNIDIDGDSTVSGAVVVDGGSLSLSNVDVDGHVYANPGDVSSCSGATLGPNDESCSEYSFKDPSDY